MSRLTGTDALGLMEAYNEVYASQELTEEQVWEEVESWVNSLVEEGYDLSDYTWDDLYEGYLTEILGMPGAQNFGANLRQQFGQARRAVGGNISGALGRFTDAVGSGWRGYTGQTTTSRNPEARFLNAFTRNVTAQPRAAVSALGGFLSGQPASSSRPSSSTRSAAPSRPAPTAAPSRPAPTAAPPRPVPTAAPPRPVPTAAPPRPVPTAAPSGPAPIAPSSIERRIPTSAELRQAQQLRATGANLTGTGALATGPATPAPAAATTTAPAAAPKPNLQQQIRQRRLNMDLDLFDIVKGYLIDEGYAETEEAAAVIMANMSEDWRDQILESGYFPTRESQMKDEAKYNLRGQAVKPRTVQTQSTRPSR